MKTSTRKKIKKIIDDHFLCEWEFITEIIAPEIDEEDFELDEVVDMIVSEKNRRMLENNK